MVSPRSYFVFTPLLASTAVGTLEFRAALEPVRGSRRASRVAFFEAWADRIQLDRKVVTAESAVLDPRPTSALTVDSRGDGDGSLVPARKEMFDISYDKLVVAVGCYSQTFGIKGVRQNAFFLKDVMDAIRIRKRVLSCTTPCKCESNESLLMLLGFELASLPTATETQKKQLLHFAVVGGGRE